MFVLTWNHTRTGKPMRVVYTSLGQAWTTILQVRTVFPHHPMFINGESV